MFQRLLKQSDARGRFLKIENVHAVENIDAILRQSDKLDEAEITFLKCCREAIKKEAIIAKLVDAVQRQASFVDKMEKQLWIRSPAVQGTLCRAIHRYSKFMKLFRLYPKTMFVPTLDIDLVWHTHQCTSYRYDAGTMKMAGRIIDHDDKLGKETLGDGLKRTKDLYRIRFAEEYEVCCCWDCEALLSAITAHELEARPDSEIIARYVHESVAYYRAVEIARRNGQVLLPIRV
jgi:Glycine-rich domain-containing protein-like